ncbi:MAG: lysophospholipid acyltransferase family protein [Candidatus Omnitrophota bacterium]
MLYHFFRAILAVLLRMFFRLKVEGLENLPRQGNFIVVANHASYLDPLALGVAIPRKIHWIAVRQIFNCVWIRWFMWGTKVLPTGGSSQKSLFLLEHNKNVGLFPEGTRTHDGEMKEFRNGAAVLALKTGRPIVPCAVVGAYEAFPRTAKMPRLLPIKVKIGKPIFALKRFEDTLETRHLQDTTFRIAKAIKELLNEKQ